MTARATPTPTLGFGDARSMATCQVHERITSSFTTAMIGELSVRYPGRACWGFQIPSKKADHQIVLSSVLFQAMTKSVPAPPIVLRS